MFFFNASFKDKIRKEAWSKQRLLESIPSEHTDILHTVIIKICVDWGLLYLDFLKAETLLIPTLAAPQPELQWPNKVD